MLLVFNLLSEAFMHVIGSHLRFPVELCESECRCDIDEVTIIDISLHVYARRIIDQSTCIFPLRGLMYVRKAQSIET